MPSTKLIDLAGAVLGFFRGLGRFYLGLCVLGAKIGLGVLVLTGEMLAMQASLQPWIPVQLLRQTHALAGLILVLSLCGQLLRFASWIWFWPRKKTVPHSVGGATSEHRGFSIRGMLDAAFWLVTLLMVLTGVNVSPVWNTIRPFSPFYRRCGGRYIPPCGFFGMHFFCYFL